MAGAGRGSGRRVAGWRIALGVLLAVLAGVLAPAAVVADWADDQVNDTEAFVARYAALAHDPRVRELVSNSATEAITNQLGLGDNALAEAVVRRTVTSFAESEAFDAAWSASLRLAHGEFRALLTGEAGSLQVAEDGQVRLRLAPFVDAVKQRLAQAGVPFVDQLPEVTAAVPVLTVDPRVLPALRLGYRVLGLGAASLGWLAVAFAVAAVWVWPRRRAALITLGSALVAGVVVVWAVTATVVRALLAGLAPPLDAVGTLLAESALSPMQSPALAVAVTGAVLAGLGALASPRPLD